MPSITFVRDTTPREGNKQYKKGDEVDVSSASAKHWYTRHAAVPTAEAAPPLAPAQRARAVKEMEKQISEIANAQPAPDTAASVDSTAGIGGGVGARTEPDASAGGLAAPASRTLHRGR